MNIQSGRNINSFCRKYDIKNYTINEDGTVDVNGDVYICEKVISRLPVKFGKVSGSFIFEQNSTTSLEGSPYEVGGGFSCEGNRLVSLEGCPTKVNGFFNCSYNGLTSLEFSPKEVGDFFCDHNQLISLEGSPKFINGNFLCSDNQLFDVKGFPKSISGFMTLYNNPLFIIFKLFPDDSNKEVAEYLNEYDVIRDGKKVVLQALEVVYDELGLEVPEDIKIKGYEII